MKMKILGWKCFHPSQWGWWKSKAKPLMVPVDVESLAGVFYGDPVLHEDVNDRVMEMEEEEEEEEGDEEVPPPDGSLEDQLDQMIEDLEEKDPNQYFESEVVDLVEERSTSATIGDLTAEKRRADFDSECG